MKCPICGRRIDGKQLEFLAADAYNELFIECGEEKERRSKKELARTSRRCERKFGWPLAAHLERLWAQGIITVHDAEILLRNPIRTGMLYLWLRNLEGSVIADIYCMSDSQVEKILKGFERGGGFDGKATLLEL